MGNSHSINSSTSTSVIDRNQDNDDATNTDCLQSGEDGGISVTTSESMNSMVPRWIHGKGHKRSRSYTVDYLIPSSTNIRRHRRSNSLDIIYKKTNKPIVVHELESNSSLTIAKDVEQQEEEQQEQRQSTPSDMFHDEVDFSSMFGKWKGKRMPACLHGSNLLIVSLSS